MSVSKAYLRKLTRVVKDGEVRAAIRAFLIKHEKEINTNKLVITSTGDVFYEGSIGKVTFYIRWGEYRKRRKSSLTGKRFRKDKAFQGSRESAERFALGNRLASKLYKMVNVEKKAYTLFCFLKKRAIALIKEGKSVDEAKDVLTDYLRSFGMLKEACRVKSEERQQSKVQVVQTKGVETNTTNQTKVVHLNSKLSVAGISYKTNKLRLKKGSSSLHKVNGTEHDHLPLKYSKARAA